ncbi:MAG: FecR domain-containing protein [Blastocatellia bacterium]|nr:FecR domain-containing protein [Blastocatellia bacterium]
MAEHLLKCDLCRREHEEIKTGILMAEQLPHVSAPESLWSEIEALLEERSRAVDPAVGRSFAAGARWPRFAIVGAALVVAVGMFFFYYLRSTGGSWSVTALEGTVQIGSNYTTGTGRLEVGELLVTDDRSRARIGVGLIGQVEVDPNSRVRLLEARMTENRLELERGRLQARISAPPRLFFVNTPSAEAIDLGCAYTLEVDDDGKGFLRVTSGWVALVRDGRESYVPRGAMCSMRPDVGPGTPYFEDVSDKFRRALELMDFENGGDEALQTVLAEARARDTFSLWHLLARVEESRRSLVFDRMVALVGLPSGVTRESVMRLDKDALERWKEELYLVWL